MQNWPDGGALQQAKKQWRPPAGAGNHKFKIVWIMFETSKWRYQIDSWICNSGTQRQGFNQRRDSKKAFCWFKDVKVSHIDIVVDLEIQRDRDIYSGIKRNYRNNLVFMVPNTLRIMR